MTIEKMPINCDMTETTLAEAARMMGISGLANLRVYVGRTIGLPARRLQGEHGFELIVLPDHLLVTPYTWGAEWNGHQVWSPAT